MFSDSLKFLACLLPKVLLATTLTGAPQVFIDDDFEDGDPISVRGQRDFWSLQTIPGSQNGILERNGFLTLFATGKAYTYAALNSPLDNRLNFFRNTVSITVEDFVLNHHGINEKDAIFRLQLNSAEVRQQLAPQSLTLRFGPKIAMLGFKTVSVGKTDAELLRGSTEGSAFAEHYDGKIKRFILTLDPHAQPGAITATLVMETDGARPTIVRSAVLDLSASEWSDDGRSALILEARRNTAAIDPDSYVSASVGRITVTTKSK